MKHKKWLCLKGIVLLLTVVLFTGCGRGSSDKVFHVMFGAPYVDEKQAALYGEKLYSGNEKEVEYNAYSFGSGESGAEAMKLSAMVAAGELDVVVCDLDNAAFFARSKMFYDLSTIFTEDELTDYSERLLSFDLLNMDGNRTGEKTPVCGIDVSDNEILSDMMGENSYGVFIICNTDDLELAKEIFLKIVNPF